jgi:hypothetical protein
VISALGLRISASSFVDSVDPSSAAALGDGFALDARLVVAEAADALNDASSPGTRRWRWPPSTKAW